MDGLPADGIRVIKGRLTCGHDVPVDLARRLPGETVIITEEEATRSDLSIMRRMPCQGPRTRSAEAMSPAGNTGLEVTFVDNEGDAFC
jgi:hypothetical protein